MKKVKYKVSAKKDWDDRTSNLKIQADFKPFFDNELKTILPKSSSKSCIELGALPGGFLTYFYKDYGYSITGLDFADNTDAFFDTMKKNHIDKYKFIKADIIDYKTEKKYDIVASFGFIEHFDDIDLILSKHEQLMQPGGYLVITVPNFRNLQYIYHFIFDRKNLAIHNTATMKISSMKKRFSRLGLEELEAKVIGQTEFWFEDAWRSKSLNRLRSSLTLRLNKILKNAKPSAIYSPLVLYVYRKPPERQ